MLFSSTVLRSLRHSMPVSLAKLMPRSARLSTAHLHVPVLHAPLGTPLPSLARNPPAQSKGTRTTHTVCPIIINNRGRNASRERLTQACAGMHTIGGARHTPHQGAVLLRTNHGCPDVRLSHRCLRSVTLYMLDGVQQCSRHLLRAALGDELQPTLTHHAGLHAPRCASGSLPLQQHHVHDLTYTT